MIVRRHGLRVDSVLDRTRAFKRVVLPPPAFSSVALRNKNRRTEVIRVDPIETLIRLVLAALISGESDRDGTTADVDVLLPRAWILGGARSVEVDQIDL